MRRIDILSREQNYFPSTSTLNEHQIVLPPELQVRRLSQQEWRYLNASSAHSALPVVASLTSSLESNPYEL